MEGEKQVSAIKPKKLKPSYILKRLFTYTYEIKKELISCVVGGAFGGIAKIVFYICAGLLLSLSKNMTAAYIGMILCCLAVPVTYYFEIFSWNLKKMRGEIYSGTDYTDYAVALW